MCTHYTQVPLKQPCTAGLGRSQHHWKASALFFFSLFWYSLSDGVGLIQQSGLRRPHVPQHERVGFSVEAGDVLSLQLLAKVSVRGWQAARAPVNSNNPVNLTRRGRAQVLILSQIALLWVMKCHPGRTLWPGTTSPKLQMLMNYKKTKQNL